ncbi:SCO6745 family protein [Streptomyces sp. CBMAI 2042]|nr:hypothetical protein [Streptomyces sp. CBMAI 2042]
MAPSDSAPPRDTSHARRCAQALNSLHSIPYFTADLGEELAPFGIEDHSSVYLTGRASPLGAADAPLVTAVLNSFAPSLVAARVPALWQHLTPARAVEARLSAAGRCLERLLGAETVASPAMSEAAGLATEAALAGTVAGRPLYAANLALERPQEPHIALWHASTLLREHRGDGHLTVLGWHEITAVHCLVLDCASGHGMPEEIVRPMRGWTEKEWAAARQDLRDRGLVDGHGRLTPRGAQLRDDIEDDTGRLDRRPYDTLGATGTEKLGRYVHGLVHRAAHAGTFPPPLAPFFAPATEKWNDL